MPEEDISPEMLADFLSSFSRVYDRSPDDLQLIHDTVIDHLKTGPGVADRDPDRHVAAHFMHVYPAVMQDPRLEPARARMVAEYGKLPVTPAIRLREFPGDSSIGVAVAVGVGIGVIVAAAIVGYCLGGPDPAPGESVEVRC